MTSKLSVWLRPGRIVPEALKLAQVAYPQNPSSWKKWHVPWVVFWCIYASLYTGDCGTPGTSSYVYRVDYAGNKPPGL